MGQKGFEFEELLVWQKSVDFADTILKITENIASKNRHYRIIEQLESAAISIALNIAEGKGRFSKKEYVRFLYIARGSLFETITLLIILNKNGIIIDKIFTELKDFSCEISKMLSGLIKAVRDPVLTNT